MKNQIPIYKAERSVAGLADKITKGRALSYCVEAKPLDIGQVESILSERIKAIATNLGQPDLYYLKSILVTVGWNANKDVFAPQEVWAARNTAEDKQVNYEHNEKDIIGHMTACYAIDAEGNTLSNDLSVDELPSKFHIVNGSVLYLKWEDEALQTRMGTIITDIAKSNIFVSMEALFNNFDYACRESKTDGSTDEYIIPRDEKSAFLTKHLKSYGGDGVYKGIEVGRLLRHITFSGKGIVKKPANPESIIFNNVNSFAGKTKSSFNFGEKKTMADTNEMVDLKKELETVTASLKLLEADRVETKKKAEADAKAAVEKEIKTLRDNLNAKEVDLAAQAKVATDGSVKISALEAAVAEANKKTVEAEAKAKVAEDAILKAKAEVKKNARIELLKAAGKEMDAASAMEIATQSLDDAAFAMIVEAMKGVKASIDEEVENVDAITDPKVLAKIEADKKTKAALNVGGGDEDKNAKLFESFNKSFSGHLKTYASIKKTKVTE